MQYLKKMLENGDSFWKQSKILDPDFKFTNMEQNNFYVWRKAAFYRKCIVIWQISYAIFFRVQILIEVQFLASSFGARFLGKYVFLLIATRLFK